jgi:hypothetical protein
LAEANLTWRTWVNGLVGALLNGISVITGDGVIGTFTGSSIPIKHTLYLAAWQGFIGVYLYLKQHPTPWDGMDRRNGNATKTP